MATTKTSELKTCQVCGRSIKAGSVGLIAHHGYKRPYQLGYQTASCEGARYAPYEVSCDRLREVLEDVRQFIARKRTELAEFLANPPAVLVTYERRWAGREGERREYTRPDPFDPNGYERSIPHTYSCTYQQRKDAEERTIRMASLDAHTMARRLAEWKPPVAAGAEGAASHH